MQIDDDDDDDDDDIDLITPNSTNMETTSDDDDESTSSDDLTLALLLELSSAIGLQRYRFNSSSQSPHHNDICRNLTRIALVITRSLLQSPTILPQISDNRIRSEVGGLFELLVSAVGSDYWDVVELALEAVALRSRRGEEEDGGGVDHFYDGFYQRVLPILHQKAIFPPDIVRRPTPSTSSSLDFQSFESFRESILHPALISCYLSQRSYYLSSCASSIESLCASPPTSTAAYQLEASLFLLTAVSLHATPLALSLSEKDTNNNNNHDDLLSRMSLTLSQTISLFGASNPLILAQLSRFVRHYAKWFSHSPTPGVLDLGGELAVVSLKLACDAFRGDDHAQYLIAMRGVSPLSEAAMAVRNILERCPGHFGTPKGLAALAGAWEVSYDAERRRGEDGTNATRMMMTKSGGEDRMALGGGICRVLTSLPVDQWVASVAALCRPTMDGLERDVTEADGIIVELSKSMNNGGGASSSSPTTTTTNGDEEERHLVLSHVLKRGSEEIRLLSVMVKTFNRAVDRVMREYRERKQREGRGKVMGDDDGAAGGGGGVVVRDHPSLAVFRRAWPCLSHLAQKYSMYDFVTNSLCDFLIDSLSITSPTSPTTTTKLTTTPPLLLAEISELSISLMSIVVKTPDTTPLLAPILSLISNIIERCGAIAEERQQVGGAGDDNMSSSSTQQQQVGRVITRLLTVADGAMTEGWGDVWTRSSSSSSTAAEGGQKPFETASRPINSNGTTPGGVVTDVVAPEAMAELFDLLNGGMRCCPVLIVTLGGEGEGEGGGLLLRRALGVAMMVVGGMDVILARSAMMFLKAVVEITKTAPPERLQTITTPLLYPKTQQTLVTTLLGNACGIYPRDILDPAALLLHSILSATASPEITQELIVTALSNDERNRFQLGDDAKNVSLRFLKRCRRRRDVAPMVEGDATTLTEGGEVVVPPTLVMDFFDDLWQMHQTDDMGMIAGGEAIQKFEMKYCPTTTTTTS